MAQEIDIDINVKTKGAQKNIQKFGVGLEGIQSGAKAAGKAMFSLNKIFKANVAIKAFNAVLDILKDTFMSNQKVVDTFATATTSLQIVFNDLFKFVENNVGVITGFFKGIFEDPVGAIVDFGNAIKDNVIERFNSWIETLGLVGSAIAKVFKGDFAGALEDAKSAGKELVDVYTGVDGSFDKIAEALPELIKKTKEYAGEVINEAKSVTKLNKQRDKSIVQNNIIKEQKDREAESLRQIRDEERNTIEERIQANNDLALVLEEQAKLMLANNQLVIEAAQAQVDLNANQENEIALLEAKAEKAAILAQIEGFRSEQKTNDFALDKERLELEQTTAQGAIETQNIIKKGQAELIDNEVLRLQKQKQIAVEEEKITKDLLESKKASYKEGTQAFIDATNELNNFNAESANTQKKLDKDIADAKVSAITGALGSLASLVGENSRFGKAIAITQAIIDTYAGATKAFGQGGVFGFVGAASVLAAGFANIKKITSTKEPPLPSFANGSSGGSISTPAAVTSSPPSINVVGASAESQLAQTIAGSQTRPVKAYVVSTEVSTQQALDRQTANQATLGRAKRARANVQGGL
jgi:hypothetical protein